MRLSLQIQNPRSRADDTLGHLIRERNVSHEYDEILISVAYMTVAGVRALLAGFSKESIKTSKWLIGLDDYVTQPGAIDFVSRIPGAEVKVASYARQGLRFHPKVYIFRRSSKPKQSLTIIGSANLTSQALAGNGEVNAVFEPSEPTDLTKIQTLWDSLWSLGHKPSAQELIIYRSAYEKHKTREPKVSTTRNQRTGMIILSSDEAELDPSEASLCWIECGYNTAMGRELELKAEQGLFFGLSPGGEPPRTFDFLVSSGDTVRLRMKYQGNHMWRLQLTNEVPEVAAGLRPRNKNGELGRSPYVAVIERTNKKSTYRLRFVHLASAKFKGLVKRSSELATYGKTTARQYGWC